jgi:cyclic pyranopterin monophosphate synthase
MATRGASPPSAADAPSASQFRMIDVGEKAVTRRRAVAEGAISMRPETARRIADGTMPKGNVLGMAEVAGIAAAKNTPMILPLCHHLQLDAVRVACAVDAEKGVVSVRCEAICSGKTGVEMEALTGASAALLSIYDLTKGVDPALEISAVRLRVKEGGKSGRWVHPNVQDEPADPGASRSPSPQVSAAEPRALAGLSAAVLTISDRCSRGEAEDASGPLLARFFRDRGADLLAPVVVPDDVPAIQAAIRGAIERGADLLVSSGGTGLGPRDVTPEALRPLLDREVPGIGELLRASGAASTKMSWLSRSVAGLVGSCLVVALPGSPRAVTDGLAVLEPLLSHGVAMIRGGRTHPEPGR